MLYKKEFIDQAAAGIKRKVSSVCLKNLQMAFFLN